MLQQLSAQYPVWFCDVWGVVHNGAMVYPPTIDSLARHRSAGGTVILVSNSPRSTAGITRQLDDIGVPRACYDAVVTSGDVTRDLMQQTDGKLYHLGPARDLSLFERLPVERVPLEQASAIICTGLLHEEQETPADYEPAFRAMIGRGLPMICANPDKVVRKAGRLIFCAGALAETYRARGGEVRMAGKPHAPIWRPGAAAGGHGARSRRAFHQRALHRRWPGNGCGGGCGAGHGLPVCFWPARGQERARGRGSGLAGRASGAAPGGLRA
ncbi:MAG: TIGR01459 family HAD-type hydrolase [Hyphomicrobiales bacterium]